MYGVIRVFLLTLLILLRVNGIGRCDEPQPPTDASRFHLFLLAGQSNMAGRGRVEDVDREIHPRVLMLNKQLQWVPAQDPLHFDKPSIVGVGPGRTFAADYARQHPDVVIGLIPCAVGGSPITAWQPGGFHSSTETHPWDDALPRIREAQKQGVLKGILWHQGESDSNAKAAPAYQRRLHTLIERFRSELQSPDLPFIAGQMGQFAERPWDEHRHLVDAAHRGLPEHIRLTGFASSDGLQHKGDKVHFDAASCRELGHRYFAAYQQVTLPDRPNVLLILADDVGREVLGCYGGESYPTPNLDTLAAEGQRYTHCYSMPVCHPTRICLMTGRYPAVLRNPKWGSFPSEEEGHTFAAVLKAAGYATAVAGKWQLSLMKNDLLQPGRMGFDRWSLFGWHEGPRYHDPLIYENGSLRTDTKGQYGPDLYVDFLIDFMSRHQSQPFFAYYSMALCHDVTDDLREPVPYGPDGHWLTYAEMAADMDRQVGRLLQSLDRLQLRNNTIVIFTTDNGTAGASYLKYEDGKFVRPKVVSRFNGRDVPGGKGRLTDWGTRVPLIVSWPGHVAPGQVSEQLVDFSDFLPTLADLTGAALPHRVSLNGHSFADVIRGTGNSDRSWAYAEGRNGQQFLRTQRFKLYRDGRFFDMTSDPEEKHAMQADAVPPDASAVRQSLKAALDLLPEPQ
ncbi:MAG: sialate O-acetylesterase [Fuerstiella sp.]